MSNLTGIEWTDRTDNIITVKDGGWWCHKISEGCTKCYAEKLNQNSFYGGNKLAYSGEPPTLELKHNLIASWARQRKPKKHFVASMTDIFGEWVPHSWHYEMLDGMAAAPRQIFQLLTKRPHIMLQACMYWLTERGLEELPSNIWVGCTVERQKYVQERLPYLTAIPANIRFVSCEPLLEPIRLDDFSNDLIDPESGIVYGHELFINYLDWVIIGGESGKGVRPCHIDWVRSLVRQCRNSATPVAPFVKQLGSNPVFSEADYPTHYPHLAISDSKGGDWDEWPEDVRFREFPQVWQEAA